MDHLGYKENQDILTEDYGPTVTKYPDAKKQNHFSNIFYLVLSFSILLVVFSTGAYFLRTQFYTSLNQDSQKNIKTSAYAVAPTLELTPSNPTEKQVYNVPKGFGFGITSPYSFKYPPNWYLEPSLRYVSAEGSYLEDVIANNTSIQSLRYQLTVETIKTDATTLSGFIADHQAVGDHPNLALNNFVKDTSVDIPNTEWMIDRDTGDNNANEYAIFLKGNTAVLLTFSNCGDDITNQIISTFKFDF